MFPCPRHEVRKAEYQLSSTHSKPCSLMDFIGQVHAPAVLPWEESPLGMKFCGPKSRYKSSGKVNSLFYS